MATTAQARRATARPRPYEDWEPAPAPRTPARAPRARPRALPRALGRTIVFFVVCLTLLAVGRVALSFAVVQKTLQTDAIVQQERQVNADNARLADSLAQLTSAVHIQYVAHHELGLVDADLSLVRYLEAPRLPVGAKGGTGR